MTVALYLINIKSCITFYVKEKLLNTNWLSLFNENLELFKKEFLIEKI